MKTYGTIATIVVAIGLLVASGRTTEDRTREYAYPSVADLLSNTDAKRHRAMTQLVTAQRDLVRQLAAAVNPKTGKELSRKYRGNACYVLAKLRTTDQAAIRALVAATDEYFITRTRRRPFGMINPSDALVAIGKPVIVPVLDELAKTKDKRKTRVLHAVLEGIEGVDCAIVRIQAHIDKERDSKKKARLKMTLKYFEDRKADLRSRKRAKGVSVTPFPPAFFPRIIAPHALTHSAVSQLPGIEESDHAKPVCRIKGSGQEVPRQCS